MIPYNKDSDSGAPWLELPGAHFNVTHEQFVTNLIKDRGDRSMNLEHMVIGICGEAGEIADAVKKNSIYGKPLNRENIVEELGDIEFYIAGLRQMLGISAKEVFEYNVKKLGERYKNGYSDAAAITRADKQLPTQEEIDASAHAGLGNIPSDYAPQVIDVTSADYLNLAATQHKQGYKDLFIMPSDDRTTQFPGWVMDEIPKWAGAAPRDDHDHMVLNLDGSVSYLTESDFNIRYAKKA